jgi:cyclic 2,3-diphosphoglycerate synthetase
VSDEPVLGPRERFRLASRVLAAGLPYAGADFELEPPTLAPFELPSIGVIGTGKRVGKTAVAGHVARLYARTREVVVVSMGRGGPPEPVVVESPPTLESLLELSRAGEHAASDYLETAALAGVVTVGCRRAGGGLAGAVAASNVAAGAAVAAARSPDLVVFDGSGASIPPVEVDRRVLVVGPGQDPTAYLNAYRVLISDLVLLLGGGDAEGVRALKDVPTAGVELRLRPAEPLEGRTVAVFTAGPAATAHLDAEVVLASENLARREALRADLARADADVFLVELKAAAIDVVAEAAAARGVRLVLADNDVVSLPGEPDVDALLEALVPEPVAR